MRNRKINVWFDGYSEEEWKEIGIEFPSYIQCYQEALAAILHTIEYNYHLEYPKGSDRFSKKETFAGVGSDYTRHLEKSNIIAFVGDRGAGKTTALNEFCRILREYSEKHEKWNSKISYNNSKKCFFHILSPIDASVLETKEDLMEVILASMYQVFQKETDSYKRPVGKSDLIQKIIREFDDVYRDYINVGNREKDQQLMGESVLAKLKYISNSSKTKNALEILIKNFLKLLDGKADEENEATSYLVIVVDDLDMSPENGFAMLDQLHKYLSNPRVIILVAIKYEQMKMICNKHFVDCITPEYGGIHKDVYRRYYEKAKRLSSDYLLKVLPRSNRVYMPEDGLLDKKGIISYSDDPERKYTVKKFVLTQIADKMNIYYDAAGTKRHFCLPDTIRELLFYDQFLDSLYSMEEIERSGGKRLFLYDQNHERFNSDIEYKMAMRILDDDQLDLYQEIMRTSVERRPKYTVSFLQSWIENKAQDKGKSSSKKRVLRLKDRVDGQPYCYSDLLEILYVLGRQDYKDKGLVHCILASFTAEMVREYYSYKYNSDEDARSRSVKCLRSFLGNTFGGKWFGECLPTIEEWLEEITVGYIPDMQMQTLTVNRERYLESGSTLQEKESWMKRELSDMFPYIERFVLLFSNLRDQEGKMIEPEWNVGIQCGDTHHGFSVSVQISGNAEKADFDIFGFIGKEIDNEAKDSGIKLVHSFINAAKEAFASLEPDLEKIDELSNELKKDFCQRSIWRKLLDTENAFAFPYYNLDMSYNIMKRVRNKIKENEMLGEMNPYDYYCTVYGYVAEGLKEEDDYYNENKGGAKNQKEVTFLKDFLESPYIQAFEIEIGDTVYNRQKNDMAPYFFEEILKNFKSEIVMPDMAEQDEI